MLRIEVATSGWQREQFERELRRRMLILLNDMGVKYPNLDINRVQFFKPKR